MNVSPESGYGVWALSNVDTSVAPQFFSSTASSDSTSLALSVNGLSANAFVLSAIATNTNAGGGNSIDNLTASLTAFPAGSGASFSVDGRGGFLNDAASGFGSFEADLAGDYTIGWTYDTSSRTALGALAFTPVPEPQSAGILVLCAVAVLTLRRRQRRV